MQLLKIKMVNENNYYMLTLKRGSEINSWEDPIFMEYAHTVPIR